MSRHSKPVVLIALVGTVMLSLPRTVWATTATDDEMATAARCNPERSLLADSDH